MASGHRYDGKPKLNKKKVFATILSIAVVIMIIVLLGKLANGSGKKNTGKNVSTSYAAAYSSGKWGVINSKGEYTIDGTYENMIVVPNSAAAVFICQSDVNLDAGTYKSYAIDNNGNKLFTSYDSVEAIQNVDRKNQIFYDKTVLKVSKNGKYGLINFSGKELVSCEYDAIEPLKYLENSFVTTKNNKKGLVDQTGTVIIENEYADIKGLTDNYENGYIVKNDSSRFGVITTGKTKVLDTVYTEIKNVYGSSMYVVKDEEGIKVVSKDGTTVVANKFDDVVDLSSNKMIVVINSKYGILDETGNTLVEATYDSLKYAFGEYYIAKKDGKAGMINSKGLEVVAFEYKDISYMEDEGFIIAEKDDLTSDLMDTSFIIKANGLVSEINSKGAFIKLRVSGDYKYYNFKLEEKTVQEVYPTNTLFVKKENGKFGYVDKEGKEVVKAIYDDATEQNEYGYAAVKKDGKWTPIDSLGKQVTTYAYTLDNNPIISFIGKWHLAPDINANYYTDAVE